MNKASNVKHVYGIVSGKGGVGKSVVTSMLAVAMARRGQTTAILDADMTGPSIPKCFGVHEKVMADSDGIIPAVAANGTELMSVNLLVDEEDTPVVWRGPVIAGTVKQFWSDVKWGDIDYMFVDMPPGTGDVPLTVFQSLPLDGIIIVTTPQELVSMIVSKAVNMAREMEVPIVGLIENYSYVLCPDCGSHINVFGFSHVEEVSKKFNIPVLASIPLDPSVSALCDAGRIDEIKAEYIDKAADAIINK
jgi:Mrp family chromosome partitioning ATPase